MTTKRISTTILALALTLLAATALRAADTGAAGDRLFELYGSVHQALATDRADGVEAAARTLAETARSAATKDPGHKAQYEQLATAAAAMKGGDLASLREGFKTISTSMAALVETGAIGGAQLYHCPMAKAYWLQPSGDASARNPYYGQSMAKCGAKVEKIGS